MTADDNDNAFLEAVGDFIDAHALIPSRATVVVAVSGGADSVALLAALRELGAMRSRQYRLVVAHLDHHLRADSAADAAFVSDLARRWQLPCAVETVDVAAAAREAGVGIEEAAREARYAFLARVAAQYDATHVAVAHHADDNVETALHRIIRGTHLHGLAAMAPRRELGEGLSLVRPLLGTHRDEVEAFCRDRGLAWRTDSTNADTAYRRNFIRHELLPLMRRLNPRAQEAVERLVAAAVEADGLLEKQALAVLAAAGAIGAEGAALACAELLAQPPVVQRYALRLALEQAGAPMRMMGAERLEELRALLSAPAGAVALGGGYEARRAGERLVIGRPVKTAAACDESSAPLDVPGTTRVGGITIDCRVEPFDRAAFGEHCRTRPAGVELLDAGKLSGPLVVRPRRAGDVFVPLGAPGRTSVSDFLTNLKLPAARRAQVRCICDDLGIVYLWPLRIDDRVKVTDGTREVLRVVVRE